MTFSLGPYSFVRLTIDGRPGGVPPSVKAVSSITQRPGVDGTGAIDHGIKGMPFPAESLVDVDLPSDARP